MSRKTLRTLTAMLMILSSGPTVFGQTTIRVNVGPGGAQATGGPSYFPAISADGRHVAFRSRATNLIAGGTSGNQIFSHDRDPDGNGIFDEGNGLTTLMSLGIDGLPGNGSQGGFNGNFGVSISANGRYVMWSSQSTNLVAGDTTGLPGYDVFVRDRDPDEDGIYDEADAYNIRVNVGPLNAEANSPDNGGDRMSITSDGLLSAFSSGATNLTGMPDTNAAVDVFVHDLTSSTTQRVSELPGGMQGPTQTNKRVAVISGNGRYVSFWVAAGPPVFYSGDTNGHIDFLIKDRLTGAISIGSVGSGGIQGNADAYSHIWGNDQGPSFSPDGRFFVFSSFASNFDAGDANTHLDVFLNDRDPDENGVMDEGNNITTLVSADAAGIVGNAGSGSGVLSGDARFIAFTSLATNLVAGDTCCQDVFLKDRMTGAVERISLTNTGAQANSTSLYSAISYDGRYVAFYSAATNLVPGDTNGQSDIFIRDRGLPVVPGDMNCDGKRDGLDVEGFSLAVLDSAQYAVDHAGCNILNGDFNASGAVELLDTAGFTDCLLGVTCP